jgi:signal transduction histidine kinase
VGREARARNESAQLRAVAHLANAAAHEINNPLTTVIGRLDMLAQLLPANSREQDLVKKARGASDRIGQMVGNMHNITHLEYLAMPGGLPATLDLKRSGAGGDRA